MDRAVEEGAAGQFLPGSGSALRALLEHDRQRVMAGGVLGRVADGRDGFGRFERNRRPTGIRRPIVGMHLGLGFAQEMRRFQLDAPAGHHRPVRRTRPGRDGAVAARQAGEAETGGVLAPDRCVVPAVLAETQQDGGIGDPRAVVGNGDGERRLAGSWRQSPAGREAGAATAMRTRVASGAACCFAEFLREISAEGGGVDSGYPLHGALVNAGPDRAVHGRTSMTGVETETPRRRRDAGGALSRGRTATGRGGGTRGSPSGPGGRHAR